MTAAASFVHEAFFYDGNDEFLDGTVPFVREGLEAGEPVLVALDAAKIRRLRHALNGEGGTLLFTDMRALGQNPARIIPAWRAFVDEHGACGRPVRGIGEPIWPGRTSDELVECHRHEALLNVAFADAAGFLLLCPYDTAALPDEVVDEARRTHPSVVEGGVRASSTCHPSHDELAAPMAQPLPAPPPDAHELRFHGDTLADARRLVFRAAGEALAPGRLADLALAAQEMLTNSVRHGGGGGTLRLWTTLQSVVCEIEDGGRIRDPLLGRIRPEPGRRGRNGHWLANQLCELVQVRTTAAGTIVRLHVRR